MMALHIWSMSHGVASLFARGGAAHCKLPMSPERSARSRSADLSAVSFPTEQPRPSKQKIGQIKAKSSATGSASEAVGPPNKIAQIIWLVRPAARLTKIRDGL